MRPEQAQARRGGRLRRLASFVRERAGVLGYAAFTLLAFAIALLWSLPHDLIATRALDVALAGAPVQVSFRTISLAPPNGYHLTDVRVTPAGKSEPIATLSEVTVRMPLLAILTASFRQAAFSGRAYGGDFTGRVSQSGARTAARLEAKGIRLEPALAAFVPPPGRVEGTATVSLDLAGDGRSTQSSEGELSIGVAGLKLEQVSVRGIRVPDIAFPTVAAAAQVYGARLQIKEANASGDDLSFAATGDVLLREPVQQSVLNLRLTVDVPSTAQPAMRLVTGLLPKRQPGESPAYTVKGTIGAPVLR